MQIFGLLLFSLGSTVAFSIWNGFILSKFWAWFIVPTFSFKPLNLIESIGLVLVISFLTAQKPNDNENKDIITKLFESVLFSILYPSVILLVGFFFKQFT